MPASTAQSTLSTLLTQHNLPPSLNPPLLSQTPPSLLHLLLSRIQGVKLPILSSEIETIKLVLGILASELTDLDLSELEPLDLVRGDEEQIGVVVLALAVLSLRRRQRQRQRKLQDPIEPDISYVSSAGSTDIMAVQRDLEGASGSLAASCKPSYWKSPNLDSQAQLQGQPSLTHQASQDGR